MRIWFLFLFSFFIVTATEASDQTGGSCTGRFINPISDICWDCIFPISIGSTQFGTDSNKPDTENYPSPICICPNPKALGLPTPGLAVGFWEPRRMVDVTKRPFCMTSIGGIKLDPGISIGAGSMPFEGDDEGRIGNWHIHWYMHPVVSLLNLIVDIACVDASGFDLSYMTELDPLWNNDVLAFILNPEAILFGNIVAQAVCAADCVSSTVWKPLDPLFWCAGCQGTMYPFTGNVAEHLTSIQSSSLAVEKFTFKLHRQLQAFITSGPEAICHPFPAPIIKKSQYRLQTTIPIAGSGSFGCNPYGKTTILHDSFKEIPITGEDFGYFVWGKRNCCIQ